MSVATCFLSALHATQDSVVPPNQEQRVRDAVADWVGNDAPIQYRVAQFVQVGEDGASVSRGTLLVAEDRIELFRLGSSEWIEKPTVIDADARTASLLSGIVPTVPMMTFDGSELPDRGIHDDAVFYKYGERLLIWSKDQTWTKLESKEIHANERTTSGNTTTVSTPRKLASIVGDDDFASGVFTSIHEFAFTVDPRSLFSKVQIQNDGVVVPEASLRHGAAYGLELRLALSTARTISNISRLAASNGDPIPGFPKDGEEVETFVVFGLSVDLKVVDVTIRSVHLWYEDVDHPRNAIRTVELIDFVPEDDVACRRVPQAIREALGLGSPASRNVENWADVLAQAPDAGELTDAAVRAEIASIGLPWKVRERTSGMTMVLVPPGEFDMGSPDSKGQPDEHPRHRVRISRPFYAGQFEVTQEQYERVLGENPSFEKMGPTFPVDGVSFEDVNRRDGFLDRTGLRLLTEAEWEYVARGHGSADYPWGDMLGPDRANYLVPQRLSIFHPSERAPADPGTPATAMTSADPGHPASRAVASYPKGASWCGVHDLAGNVAELCVDIYDSRIYDAYSQRGVAVDPTGPRFDARSPHVVRGGDFMSRKEDVRCARRNRSPSTARNRNYGFRCVRNP